MERKLLIIFLVLLAVEVVERILSKRTAKMLKEKYGIEL